MSIVEELRRKQSRDNRDLLDRAADRIEELERELLLINESKSNNSEVKSNNSEDISNKEIDLVTELLIDFDEMGFIPTTTVPDPEAYAIEWRNKITNALKGYRKERQGEWEKVSEKYPRYVCTFCNHLYNNKGYQYCPNCGARMKGE